MINKFEVGVPGNCPLHQAGNNWCHAGKIECDPYEPLPDHCPLRAGDVVVGMKQKEEPVTFDRREFNHNGRRFVLNRSVECKLSHEDEIWTYECEELGMQAYHEDRKLANADFHEDFAVLWDSIACEKDEGLTVDARRLKQKLLKLVKKVIII